MENQAPPEVLGGGSGAQSATIVERGSVQINRSGGRGRQKKTRTLKWGTINAQSLQKKMTLLEYEVKKHDLKIVSVTESWGKDKIGDSHFKLNNFKMYRDDRGVKGGG